MTEALVSRYEYNPEQGKIYMTSSVYRPFLIEHTHGFVELICITRGCGIHTIDGHSVRTRRGDIFLIDYGVRHNFHPLSEPFEWINCIFRKKRFAEKALKTRLFFDIIGALLKKLSTGAA